jgi:hypothetical protein
MLYAFDVTKAATSGVTYNGILMNVVSGDGELTIE